MDISRAGVLSGSASIAVPPLRHSGIAGHSRALRRTTRPAALAAVTLAGHDDGMIVFLLIAAVLVALAVYRSGRARGSWRQWRASVSSVRANRGSALKSSGQVALLAAGQYWPWS
jgi:hypothetical protein